VGRSTVARCPLPRNTTLSAKLLILRSVAERETVADRLRRLQQKHRFSVTELARAARVSEGAIRQIRNGTTKMPSLLTGLRLADALGVTAWYIATGRDSDPKGIQQRSMAALIEVQERQGLEITALNRRVNTLEGQVAAVRRRNAPRSR
jgi:transcriptional regulator with XRE-family HTH domain